MTIPPLAIRARYNGGDSGQASDIAVDGKVIAKEYLTRRQRGARFGVYPIPPELTRDKDKVTVRFEAKAGSLVGGLYDLRMVEQPLNLSGMTTAQLIHSRLMRYADTARGRPLSKDPSVVFFRGKYFLYYSLGPWTNGTTPPPGVNNGWTIGIATSDDLTHWTKAGELLPAGDYEKQGLCAPGAIVLNDKVHLFYQTYGNGPKDAICHATSDDGIRFTRNASHPIFHPQGSWTNGRAIDAEAIPLGDRLMLYFATRDLSGKIQKVGVASVPLTSNFARDQWRQECIGSILSPELDWEKNCIEAPTVMQRGNKLFMFYAGAYDNEPQQIGVAISIDGLTWRRLSEQPLMRNGAPGSWNESESGHPGIFLDPKSGRTYLFFQGNNDNGQSWYLSKVEVIWREDLPFVKEEDDKP